MKRLSVPISDELDNRVRKVIPRGHRSVAIRGSLHLVLDFIEEHGSAALGLIINGDIKLAEKD